MRFQDQDQGGPILPPRPNPGPEPWIEARPWDAWLLAGLGLAMLAVLIGLAILWWRRRRARRRRLRPIVSGPDGSALPPRDQMIVWSEAIRDTLLDRFGPTWGARTTEEIAGAPELVDRLGQERAERLARFLAEADRAKFAAEAHAEHHPEHWASWVSAFLEEPGPGTAKADRNSSTSQRP